VRDFPEGNGGVHRKERRDRRKETGTQGFFAISGFFVVHPPSGLFEVHPPQRGGKRAEEKNG
jgi:hypothetical protein